MSLLPTENTQTTGRKGRRKGKPRPKCPICGGREFGGYRGRKKEKCRGCGAKQRIRGLYLLLPRLDLEVPGKPFFHFSPERAIAGRLIEIFWDQYRPVDIGPERFKSPATVQKFDLATDLATLPDNSLAGFFHSHVLEHVAAPLSDILPQMDRVLAPGGMHIMCLPFLPGCYAEDPSPGLTDEDRLRRFGQHNHVRRFGLDDFEDAVIRPYFANYRVSRPSDFITPREARRNALLTGDGNPDLGAYIFKKNKT